MIQTLFNDDHHTREGEYVHRGHSLLELDGETKAYLLSHLATSSIFHARDSDTHPDLIQSHEGIKTMKLFMKHSRVDKQDV